MVRIKVTEKQKAKLKKSGYFRKNSSDLTVNKNYSNSLGYVDGEVTFDGRTREGKEVKKILNSRNRTKKHEEEIEPFCSEDIFDEPDWYEMADEEDWDEEDGETRHDEDDDVPFEFQNSKNFFDWLLGPDHDEDEESVADLYDD